MACSLWPGNRTFGGQVSKNEAGKIGMGQVLKEFRMLKALLRNLDLTVTMIGNHQRILSSTKI